MIQQVPKLRVRVIGNAAPDPHAKFVLYWMIAQRRVEWNFALQRAAEWARELNRPLVVFEPLRCGYRWASDRFHQFIIQGMADNARQLAKTNVHYFPYVERSEGEGRGLLRELAKRSCVVIGDDFPCFFLPRMLTSAADQIPVRFELVDSNGLLPMRAADKVFSRAYDFRRFLQKNLLPHLHELPAKNPLGGSELPVFERLPLAITRRWKAADVATLADRPELLLDFPIDHRVPVVAETPGGAMAAQRQLRSFIRRRLEKYELRNDPMRDVASGLSPYLHFGHLSAHQVFAEVAAADGWSPGKLGNKADGSSTGWWGASEAVESFFDQLITWRELGYNFCWQRDDYDQYDSLPEWARATLEAHRRDGRERTYSLAEFESAATHDQLWNAAQGELLREGRMHNYLRMLWGKKVLEWTEAPREAADILIELNNKYALDGRNPNSYSGIFWCFGRYDRAWGPERPIFGKVRYMSSENTRRKWNVRSYVARHAPPPGDER